MVDLGHIQGDTPDTAMPSERMPRFSRLLSAECKCHRIGPFRLVVRNISGSGLGGRSSVSLQPGDRVEVTLPALEPLFATVRWVAGDRCGLASDVPIDVERLKLHNPTGGFSTAEVKDAAFELYRHKVVSTYRPPLSTGEPKKRSDCSNWNDR